MSIRFRGLRLSKKALYICLVLLLVVGVSVSLVFALSPKVEKLNVIQNADETIESISNEPLVDANGWNNRVVTRLEKNLSKVSDNMALGNASGVLVSSIVTFGGIEWTVMYKQNNTITLLANEAVATLPYDDVRNFLNDEFYPAFCDAVGYSKLESLIVPFGSFSIYYQVPGAQNVKIETLGGSAINANDEIVGDKFWLPSAYEIGGFANTAYSPKARANSFKTVKTDGVQVNTGLFNTSNVIRSQVENYWIRNSTENSNLALVDGVVRDYDGLAKVRPCVNLRLPNSMSEQTEGAFSAVSEPKFATYTGPWASGGTNIYLISSTSDLLALSQAVLDGNTFKGVTFKLTCDLDFSNCTVWFPIGYRTGESSTNRFFQGTFDGQGHKISNLSSANSGLVGLFGFTAYNSGDTSSLPVIMNVAVVDSTWYTTSSYIGGIVGFAAKTMIQNCYNGCGISGDSYVGGIVGNGATGSVHVDDCYNTGAISGNSNVGGIAGGATSTTGNRVVLRCYNKGSVVGVTNVDGICASTNWTITNGYSYNATTRATNLTYDQMRNANSFTGFVFTGDDSVWYMPKSANERMPMLKAFITGVNVKTYAYVNGVGLINQAINSFCTVGVYSGNSLVSTNLSPTTNYTVKAVATFTTGYHYHLQGWYYAEINSQGIPVNFEPTGWTVSVSAGSGSTTYSVTQQFNASDEYVLVAKFERLFCFQFYENARGFSFSGSDYTSHLTTTYTTPQGGTATPYTSSGGPYIPEVHYASNPWYPEGTVVTATLNLNSLPNSVWWRILYSTTAVSGVPSNILIKDITVDGRNYSYSMVMQDTSSYTNFSNAVLPAGDVLYLYMDHVRRMNITVGAVLGSTNAAIPKDAYGNVNVSVLRTSSGTYNDGYSLAATNVSEPYTSSLNNWWSTESFNPEAVVADTNYDSSTLNFDGWILYYNNADKGTLTAGTSKTFASLNVNPTSIETIYIYARFSARAATVTLVEQSGQESYGLVRLATVSNITTISAEDETNYSSSIVNMGSTVYVYVLPNYANFWTLNTVSNGSNLAMAVVDNTTGIYRGSFTVEASGSITYTISYKARSDLGVTYEIDKTRVASEDQDKFTLPSNLTNKDSEYSISSAAPALLISTNNSANTKYYLYAVQKKVGLNYVNLGTKNPGTTYPTSYAILNYLGTNNTVGKLITAEGTTASYSNRIVILRLVIYPINYTITTSVTCDDIADQTVTSLYSYTQKIGVSEATSVINGQAQLASVVTLSICKFGYDVRSVTISGATWSTTPSVGTDNDFGALVTGEFTMPAEAVTITISVATRSYALYLCDNLNTNDEIGNINNAPLNKHIDVLDVSNHGGSATPNNFSLTRSRTPSLPSGFSGSTSGSTISCNTKYGAEVAISNIKKEYSWTNNGATYNALTPEVWVFGYDSTNGYQFVRSYLLSGGGSYYSFNLYMDNDQTHDGGSFTDTQISAYTKIVIVLVYSQTQQVKITFSNSVISNLTESVLIVLGREDSNGNIVSTLTYLIIPDGNSTAECKVPMAGDYKVLTHLAMCVGVTLTGNSVKDGVITVPYGEEAQVLLDSAPSTNGEGVFVFVIV